MFSMNVSQITKQNIEVNTDKFWNMYVLNGTTIRNWGYWIKIKKSL